MRNKVFVDNLFLNISTICNMKCSRCFSHLDGFRDEIMMNMGIARTATNIYFKQRNPECLNPFIMLFGGEPLLNQDLLMEFIPWVKQQYQTINFRLCLFTNGLALSETLLDYFLSNDILLFVSMDGEYDIHRKNRNITIDEYKHIVSMIKKSLESEPNSLIPYCVIQREDLALTHDILSYIASLGAGSIAITKNFGEYWGEEDKTVLFKILKEIKEERNINIFLYPEKSSDCATCSPKNMMVYPNGEIFDLCYTCSSVLVENGAITHDDSGVMHFGNIKDTQELYLNVEKKRELIETNIKCSFTGKKNSPIETFLATSAIHPLFRKRA